jgi:ATP-binding protein involved in chromosome partitioning
MTGPTQEQVLDALRTVLDPELQKDLVTLGMIKDLRVDAGTVHVTVELTTPACPLRNLIRDDVEKALRAVPGVQTLQVEMTAKVRAGAAPAVELPGVQNIIAIGAGKGGVGKSTIAVLTAVGLARAGAKVGLLDADIYGPSIPKMLGIEDIQPSMIGDNKIAPVEGPAGVKVISMGLLVDPGRPIIWRGPMIHNVLQQFLQQVAWGELDYLVVDLPPGTGDVPLSLAQSIPITGAVVVCTPQDVALADAVRALHMYENLGVSILGIVENMSYFVCPSCTTRHEIFGHGGAERTAGELGVPFLGGIPINIGIRVSGDMGTPLSVYEQDDAVIRQTVTQYVEALAGQVSKRNATQPPPQALRTNTEGGCGGHAH